MRKKTPMPHVELYPHELLVLNIAANLWRANAQVHHQLRNNPRCGLCFKYPHGYRANGSFLLVPASNSQLDNMFRRRTSIQIL